MENQDIDKQDVDLENNEPAKTEEVDKDAEKAIDYKAEAAKWKRIAERNAKKEEPRSEAKSEPSKEPSDLDYGQRALLRAIGIKGPDETQLAKDYMKRAGVDVDALETDDIFQARLEKLRTTKANELAASGDSNRGRSGGGKDTAEYWLAKLGPNDDVPNDLPRGLREQIVEARTAKGKSGKMFYSD